MIKFREHRGGLGASMATVREVADRDALVAWLAESYSPYGVIVTDDMIAVEPYGFDSRIGWDTYIVTIAGHGVAGFTSGPLG